MPPRVLYGMRRMPWIEPWTAAEPQHHSYRSPHLSIFFESRLIALFVLCCICLCALSVCDTSTNGAICTTYGLLCHRLLAGVAGDRLAPEARQGFDTASAGKHMATTVQLRLGLGSHGGAHGTTHMISAFHGALFHLLLSPHDQTVPSHACTGMLTRCG